LPDEAASDPTAEMIEVPAGLFLFGVTEEEFQRYMSTRTIDYPGIVEKTRQMMVIPPESVSRLASDLEAAGVRASVRTVSGAQHAFMNDSRPDVYDATAAAEGWDAMLSFFRAELG